MCFTLKQEKEAGTNFLLLCQLRNMVGHFKKTYLQKPIKILYFLVPAIIQKYLTQPENILAFLTINHLEAESPI